jgi:centractin
MNDSPNPNSKVLICDFGSYKVKAGLNASEVADPKANFHSLIGKPKYRRCFDSTLPKDVVSPSSQTLSLYRTETPVSRGIISKPNQLQLLMERVQVDLKFSTLADTTVFVLEPLLTSVAQKRMLADYVFEKTQSTNIVFGAQPILSFYSTGHTGGIVIESGHGLTQIAPVYDSFKIDDAYQCVQFGGQDVTENLKTLLQRFGIVSKYEMNDYLFTQVKKEICRVNPEPAAGQNAAPPPIKYTLPDNREVEIDGLVQLAPEILFQSSPTTTVQRPLQDTIMETINRLDPFMRRRLFEQVVVTGGNSLIRGFSDRLKRELQAKVPQETRVNFHQVTQKPDLVPYFGALAITSTSIFVNSVISAMEFKESGDRILLEKRI